MQLLAIKTFGVKRSAIGEKYSSWLIADGNCKKHSRQQGVNSEKLLSADC